MTERDRFGEPVIQPAPVVVEHDPACVNGWLAADDEGRPVPCTVCRPWLAACPTCGKAQARCEFERSMVGRCCPACPHVPPVTKTRRQRIQTQETSP